MKSKQVMRTADNSFDHDALRLAVLALILAAYPPFFTFLAFGDSAYFKFFAADTFYYLTVADISTWSPIFSFDGTHPTNGFHPLWQAFLKIIFSFHLFRNVQPAQIAFVFWASTFFVVLSTAIITYRLKASLLPHSFLVIIAVVPGFFYILFAVLNSNYGSIWSYINGMESPLSIFLFALLLFKLLKSDIYNQSRSGPFFALGLIATLLVMARLDDVFILAALCIPFLWANTSIPVRIRQSLSFIAIPLATITAYLLLNHHYAGTYLPISGQAKGGFAFFGNISFFLDSILPISVATTGDWSWWSETTWRAMHMIIPAMAAGIFLGYVGLTVLKEKRKPSAADSVLSAFAFYVLCKAGYNLIFVGIWHQGHWYYPISILIANIISAYALSQAFTGRSFILRVQLFSRFSKSILVVTLISTAIIAAVVTAKIALGQSQFPDFFGYSYLRLTYIILSFGVSLACFAFAYFFIKKSPLINIPVALILSVLIILVTANSMLNNKDKASYMERYELLFKSGSEISTVLLAKEPEIKLLSFDDGIVAYSLQLPTMSGLGFALDKEAFDAKAQGSLLKLAYDRGYRWITSLNYMPAFTGEINEDVSDKISAFWMSEKESENWSFKLIYTDPETNLKIVRFDPNDLAQIPESDVFIR
jgi:hypothetical protein